MKKRWFGAVFIAAVAGSAAAFSLPKSASASASAYSTEEHNRTGLRDCDCRAGGALWRQGQELCVAGQLQVCTMEQNVTAWKPTGKTCPTALLFTPIPQKKTATVN